MTSGLPHNLKVLFVTYTVPWRPRYGGALRCHGVIKELAKRCDLHVALADSNPQTIEAYTTWSFEADVTRHVLPPDKDWTGIDDRSASRTVWAVLGRGKYSNGLRRLENSIQPQIVWYFQAESLRRTAFPIKSTSILDHDNVRWRMQARLARTELGAKRYLAWLKSGAMRVDEVLLALRVSHSLVASESDVNLFRPARSVSVLPNGFDFPATMPVISKDSKRLLFYGSLFYKPNADGVRWMCREIWPLIRAQDPEAQLDVVGLGNEALSDIAGIPGVVFHGFVDDLDAMIAQAAALVVPLRVAGGTRIKILEAWAKGLPVVSTSIGAEGLTAQDGETFLLADSAEGFADRCYDVLSNVELRRRIATAGYVYGRSKFDWIVIGSILDDILDKVISIRRQGP